MSCVASSVSAIGTVTVARIRVYRCSSILGHEAAARIVIKRIRRTSSSMLKLVCSVEELCRCLL